MKKEMMMAALATILVASITIPTSALAQVGAGGCYTSDWPATVEATSSANGNVRLTLGPAISAAFVNPQISVTGNVVTVRADVFEACSAAPPPPPPVLILFDVGPLAPGAYQLRTEFRFNPPLPPNVVTNPFVVLGQPSAESVPTLTKPFAIVLALGVLAVGGLMAGALRTVGRTTS